MKTPTLYLIYSGEGRAERGLEQRGFSLIEILVTMAIFSVLMTGVFRAYFSQLDHTTREYRLAESEIEQTIAKRIIEQDMLMSGYGLADDYGSLTFDPMPVTVVNGSGTSDELIVRGTSLGIQGREGRAWSYIETFNSGTGSISFRDDWEDTRELLTSGNRVILLEPSSKKLLTQNDSGGTERWLYSFTGTTSNVTLVSPPASSAAAFADPQVGVLVYGLYTNSSHDAAAQPYFSTRYYLGGTSPAGCAPGTLSLERTESVERDVPAAPSDSVTPMLTCVLDFQVALGLDTDEDGDVDNWDNGGAVASGYDREQLNKRLKRIKVFYLVQNGHRDEDYTFPATDSKVWVGEGSLGREVTLTAEQLKYRWRLVSLSVQPRNVR